MADEETASNNNPTLEERWARVREQADEIGCEIELSIVVGGLDETDVYRVRRITDAGPTLDDQLATMERVIVDDRTKGAAEATKRMKDAEDIGKILLGVIRNRRDEYREAIAAFHQTTSAPPADGDAIQGGIGVLTTIFREEDEQRRIARLLNQEQPEATEQSD